MDWKKIRYDAIVVGSGAAGGMAARSLTEGGASVLVLEAGPELPSTGWREQRRSPQAFEAKKARQRVQSRSLSYNDRNCHLFIDDIDNPYSTGSESEFAWIRSRQAGGRTLLWNRFALRMSNEEFTSADRDDRGASWPITYEDLAPYYDHVETLLGVRGTAECLTSIPDGCFLSCETPAYLTEFRDRIERRFPDRHLVPAREATEDTGTAHSQPPSHSSIGSTLVGCNPAKLTFRSNSMVARLELDRPRHAKGVTFVDRETMQWHEASARVIVLCASTIESVRILLASLSRAVSTKLASSSGLVGHYLMDHFGGSRLIATGRLKDCPSASRARAYIPSFCNVDGKREEFCCGYGIQADFEVDPYGSIILTMGVFGEVLPYHDNFIELDPVTKDACGLAVPRIHFQYRDNEYRMARHAQRTTKEIVEAMGLKPVVVHDELLAPGIRAHELGGARMGTTSENSVLNKWNQCWDIDNVFVTDGACFPSAGYKGPTLTIMALTARSCDHILRRLRAGHL